MLSEEAKPEEKKEEAAKIYKDIKANYVNAMVVQSQEIDKYIERATLK